MSITKTSFPRRAFLQGVGAAGVLPFLQALTPGASTAAAAQGRGEAKVKPLMAKTTPDAEALLTPPPYASPNRVDELVKKSEPRRADPFDLAPPLGGAAPPPVAGTDPEPQDNDTGPVSPESTR